MVGSPPREGCRNTDEGILISILPDWCRTTINPVPYTIYARQDDHEANTTATVRQTGMRSHVKASLITTCHNDEPGTGLGVKSNTVGSVCTPQTWSNTVRFEGRNAVRHNDIWKMNNANTIGRMTYIKNVNSYDTTPQSKQEWNVLPSDRQMMAFVFDSPVETGQFLRGPFYRLPKPPLPLAPRTERPTSSERTPDTNRTTADEDKERKACRIAPYKTNKCDGDQAHHGVVDFPLRLGDSESAEKGGDERVPGAPDYPDALTICLDAETHTAVHDGLNRAVTSSAINGLTDWGTVRSKSFDTIDEIPDEKVSKHCKELYKRLLDQQYDIEPDMPLRGTTKLPENVPGAYETLTKAWGIA